MEIEKGKFIRDAPQNPETDHIWDKTLLVQALRRGPNDKNRLSPSTYFTSDFTSRNFGSIFHRNGSTTHDLFLKKSSNKTEQIQN